MSEQYARSGECHEMLGRIEGNVIAISYRMGQSHAVNED
jgi:hypothetical protein